jgi:hypothetical protein
MAKQLAERALWLDLFKVLLIWGMVSAHVIQLLGFRLGAGADAFSTVINLLTFSGFMLAFGIGVGLSRSTRLRPWQSRLLPVAVMLACAWLSGLAFAMLVDRKPISAELLADLLSFRVLFGYSEFLATFVVLYLVIAVARPLLVGIAERPLPLLVAIVLCFASTALTTDQLIPLAGTIIGHRKYASFPLLPYLPWFLVGIRIGRRDGVIGPVETALAVVGTGYFTWAWWRMGFYLPDRFPPSIAWIVGPAVLLLIYLVVARAIVDWRRVPSLLLAPGRHVLAALLLSNLIIFTSVHFFHKPAHALWTALLIALAILIVVTLWCAGWDRLRRPRVAAA